MGGFDFDDWAALYRHDPAAFEARRQAVLALELAKASPKAAQPARAALMRLDEQLAGKDEAQRIQTSMIWMAASLKVMSARIQDLADTVAKVERSSA